MKTFQDFQKVGENEQDRMLFIRSAINDHKSSLPFRIAMDAEMYDKQQNVTITTFRNLLYTVTGEVIPDNYSANYKLASNFFDRLTTQRNSHLLGNGVTFQKDDTKDKLGQFFDEQMLELGHSAQKGGVSFGFWNNDHLEVFDLINFVPLYDEENGALMAGIRFWQIAPEKPLRATLYELDGLTDYIWTSDKPNGEVMENGEKRAYKTKTTGTPVDATYIYQGENYAGFPIIPLFNVKKQSDLIGMREPIDCYDLIKSGFANTVDEASLFYWTITNAMGMDEVDVVKFRDQIKRIKAGMIERNGAQVEAHTVDAPYASREALLTRLRNDLYEDYMAEDIHEISAGATTATQIDASYEPLNLKTDSYESRVTTFILQLLNLLGIDDKPTYKRSKVHNKAEEIQVILQAAQFLPEEYVTKSILTIMGDTDALEEVKRMKRLEELERQDIPRDNEDEDEEKEGEDDDNQGQLTEEEEE